MNLIAILAASFLIGLLELFFVRQPIEILGVLFFATITFPASLTVALNDYSIAKRKETLEYFIPHASLQLSSFPLKTPTEVLIKQIKLGNFGELSSEFALVEKRLNSGATLQAALGYSVTANESILLKRFCSLLALSHRSGGDVSNAFKSFADDAFDLQNLKKECAAATAIQKYTILFAGGIVAPAILATLLTVSSSLSLDAPSFVGLSLAEKQAISQAVVLGSYLYLIAFSFLSSLFLSVTESSKRKAVLYFLILLPLSLAVFTIIRGL